MHLQERVCAMKCSCCEEEKDRRFNVVEGEYEILICNMCGTIGTHLKCAGLTQGSLDKTCKSCFI